MDLYNPKVYSDTSITDGLVNDWCTSVKELPLLLETLDTGAWKVLSASKISQMWQKRIWGGGETLFYYLKPHFSNGSGLGSFF